MLSPKTYPRWDGTEKDGIKEIFNALAIGPKQYQMGKTKVFIKNPTAVFKLEEERDEKVQSRPQPLLSLTKPQRNI